MGVGDAMSTASTSPEARTCSEDSVAVPPNRAATDRVAQQLILDKELYGDDVTSLLDGVGLRKPEIDVLEESTWPAI